MCQPATNKKFEVFSIYEEMRRDPTRTAVQRRKYAGEMRKRFRWLRGIIRDAIIEKDVFDIAGGHEGIQDNRLQINVDSRLGRNAFAFPRVTQKVSAFMSWLESQVEAGILEVSDKDRIGDSIDESWQNVFLEDTYKRGVQRANSELRRARFPNVSSIDSRGGMQAVMGLPMHVDRLGVLYTRSFTGLKDITESMDNKISTVLTQGLADGDGPRAIAQKLNSVLGGRGATPGKLGITDSLGRFIPAQRRAEMLARTEIVRAHHHGMMQEYRNYGLEGVHVQAEFRNAGDDRVCPECEGLEGTIYSLDEAQNLIPVHPMCRCVVLPSRIEDQPQSGSTEEGEMIPEEYLPEDLREELRAGTQLDGLERAISLDSSGNRIGDIVIGEEGTVEGGIPAQASQSGAGITSIHTHPTMTTFSTGDITTFARHEGLDNMVVVMPNGKAQMISKTSQGTRRVLEDRVEELFGDNYRSLVDKRSDELITKAEMKRQIVEYQKVIVETLHKEGLFSLIDETGLINI